jgi:tetratricopeptide (TPR) repeat protein
MKRTFIKSSLLAASLLLLGACADRLDVLPTQTIDAENALTTSGDVLGALIGTYDGLQNTNGLGGTIQLSADLMGQDGEIRFAGTFGDIVEIATKAMTTINRQADATWSNGYDVINRANNVLANVDKVVEGSRARAEGEARFLRGTMHFELVRLYARAWNDGTPSQNPGIPIVLTPTKVTNPTPEEISALAVRRNTVAEVYAQVIEDLTRAEALLPVSNTYYANRPAAAAMLSRVYLMQGDYANALAAANRAITTQNTLVTPWTSLYNNFINTTSSQNPPEYLFTIRVTEQDGASALNTYYGTTVASIPGTAGRSDVRILERHRQQYEAGDVRNWFIGSGTRVFTRKYLDRFANVPIIRLAELYLTRAECNLRLNSAVGATPLADVNRIRQRVNLPALTQAQLTIPAVLRERRLELAFEGHWLHDLKRTGTDVNADLPWNSPKLIFPIPQREIDANTALTQNEGYQ